MRVAGAPDTASPGSSVSVCSTCQLLEGTSLFVSTIADVALFVS
jgi:hypothetical protein